MEGNGWGNPFWWKGLGVDTAFIHFMKCRWKSLRETYWSDARIFYVTDSPVNALADAVNRNFER